MAVPLLLALAQHWRWLAWWLLVLGAATDALDGWLARRGSGGATGAVGARLDPLCDKLLLLAPLLWLSAQGVLPLLATWLLLAREFLITGWREQRPGGAPAAAVAKWKTISLFVAMGFLLWPGAAQPLCGVIGLVLFWLALVLAMVSGWQYLAAGRAASS